jgi:hypothetical protein
MSESLVGDSSKTAVSQYAETNRQRAVLTKQANPGQETVVATEPSKREAGSRDVITAGPSCDLELDVHLDMSSLPTTKWRTPLAVLRRWYWRSRLRALLPELRSLRHRMELVLEIHAWEHLGYREPLPSVFVWAETLEAKNATRAYMRYTEQLLARFPFLTIVDLSLVEQGWMAGWELGCRNCNAQSQSSHPASANPDGGNSMPPSGVPQPSKREPSNPLPSRE